MVFTAIPEWLKENAEESNFVVFSYCRIYRNIDNIHFQHYITAEEKNILDNIFENTLKDELICNSAFRKFDYEMKKLSSMDALSVKLLKEEMILPFKKNIIDSILYIDKKKSNSVLTSAGEHITIQSIKSGLSIYDCFENVYKVEHALDKKIDFAFDKQFGYLTSRIDKTGIAMNIMAALSIPVISWWNKNTLQNLIHTCEKSGYKVFYNEEFEMHPVIYIKNKNMIGVTEKSVIDNFVSLITGIINTEKKLRERLIKVERSLVEDKIFRSQAILTSARKLSYNELVYRASWIRAGIYYSLLDTTIEKINALMLAAKQNHLKVYSQMFESEENSDILRARVARIYMS